LAFTDDCLPQPNWLELLVAGEREHPGGALVGGTIVNGLTGDVVAATSQCIVDLAVCWSNRWEGSCPAIPWSGPDRHVVGIRPAGPPSP
jgi:hypothetical protein